MLTMRKMNPMRVNITNPNLKRVIARTDAVVNKVNAKTSGIHSEMIRAATIYDANQKLNQFYTDMNNKYDTFEVINVTTTQAFAGFVYTVTYRI